MMIKPLPSLLAMYLLCFLLKAGYPSSAVVHAEGRPTLSAQQVVEQMVRVESEANKERDHYLYREKVRSARTHGHLWNELVIETANGRLRRLVSEDGHPLSRDAEEAERRRITSLVDHPDQFRHEAEGRKQDEERMSNILARLSQIYQFETQTVEGDVIRIAFRPNPSFQEASYEDRVVHAMSGVLSIHQPEMRLCGIEAHLQHKVQFGFGLLGEVSEGSYFSIVRSPVEGQQWKTTKLRIHVDGSMLLLKSFARDEDASHYDFKQVGGHLTVAEAANILRTATF